jgi:hypothetical protein
MRIKIIAALSAVAMLAVPTMASAAGGPVNGPVANQPGASCFGNWRAGAAQYYKANGSSVGEVVRERAQDGINADLNHAVIDGGYGC